MWAGRTRFGPTGYAAGLIVLNRYLPSESVVKVADPSKFGSSAAGFVSLGCVYRPWALACQTSTVALRTGSPARFNTRPMTLRICPSARPDRPGTLVRSLVAG